jgi:hypothetical protein
VCLTPGELKKYTAVRIEPATNGVLDIQLGLCGYIQTKKADAHRTIPQSGTNFHFLEAYKSVYSIEKSW